MKTENNRAQHSYGEGEEFRVDQKDGTLVNILPRYFVAKALL